VEARYRELLEGNPHLERLFLADTREWRRDPAGAGTRKGTARPRAASCATSRPDTTIDAQGLWKSAVLARAAGAPVIGFSGRGSARRLLGDSRLRRASRRRPKRAMSWTATSRSCRRREFPIVRRGARRRSTSSRERARRRPAFLAEQRRPYACTTRVPGARRRCGRKRSSPPSLAISSGPAGLAPVLSWGPDDESRVARVESLLPTARKIPRLGAAVSRASPRAPISFSRATPDRSTSRTRSARARWRSSARPIRSATARIAASRFASTPRRLRARRGSGSEDARGARPGAPLRRAREAPWILRNRPVPFDTRAPRPYDVPTPNGRQARRSASQSEADHSGSARSGAQACREKRAASSGRLSSASARSLESDITETLSQQFGVPSDRSSRAFRSIRPSSRSFRVRWRASTVSSR
jgi:hypothetical protein